MKGISISQYIIRENEGILLLKVEVLKGELKWMCNLKKYG